MGSLGHSTFNNTVKFTEFTFVDMVKKFEDKMAFESTKS